MRGDPTFLLLKYQAWMRTEQFEDKILGAIVRQPASPSTNYVPDTPLQYATDGFQDGLSDDFTLAGAGASSKSGAAGLGSIAGFSMAGAREETFRLEGKRVRWKRIQQLDRYWAGLVTNEEVKRTTPQWIRPMRDVCLVVGIMVCEQADMNWGGARSRTVEGNAQLPIGHAAQAAGAPLGHVVDPSINASVGHEVSSQFQGSAGESMIFAVELRKVTTDLIRRRRLKLQDEGPNMFRGRLAGAGGEDQDDPYASVTASDMILDEFADDELEDLFG